jgi:hypothetical protein
VRCEVHLLLVEAATNFVLDRLCIHQHTLPARVPDRVSLRLSFGTFLELSTRRLPQVRLLFCRSPSSQPWTRTKLVGICETYGVGDSIVLESHYYSKNVILPRKGSKSNHRSSPNLVSFFVFSFRYRMSVLFLYSRPAAWALQTSHARSSSSSSEEEEEEEDEGGEGCAIPRHLFLEPQTL